MTVDKLIPQTQIDRKPENRDGVISNQNIPAGRPNFGEMPVQTIKPQKQESTNNQTREELLAEYNRLSGLSEQDFSNELKALQARIDEISKKQLETRYEEIHERVSIDDIDLKKLQQELSKSNLYNEEFTVDEKGVIQELLQNPKAEVDPKLINDIVDRIKLYTDESTTLKITSLLKPRSRFNQEIDAEISKQTQDFQALKAEAYRRHLTASTKESQNAEIENLVRNYTKTFRGSYFELKTLQPKNNSTETIAPAPVAVAEPGAEPEPVAAPESVAEPVAAPESVAEPVAAPESVAEPVAAPESVAEPKPKTPEKYEETQSETLLRLGYETYRENCLGREREQYKNIVDVLFTSFMRPSLQEIISTLNTYNVDLYNLKRNLQKSGIYRDLNSEHINLLDEIERAPNDQVDLIISSQGEKRKQYILEQIVEIIKTEARKGTLEIDDFTTERKKDDDRYFIQQLTKKFETDLYNPKEGEINKSRILLGIISALYEKSEANPPQYITQPGGQRLLNSDYYLRDFSKRLSEQARNLIARKQNQGTQ